MQIDDEAVLRGLNELVRETFLLWDEIWVDFSWRHYYFNHTQRVRALSLEIGRREGADLRKLEYSAVLHDITKRYDGKALTNSQGKRILDENGFWHNELLMPKRENFVTRLYRELNQFGNLHNVSGASVAKRLLESYGLPSSFCSSVGSIIRSHLNPDMYEDESSPADILEKRILYEADTIDANIGLPAFYRNVQIHTHYARAEKDGSDLEEYVSHVEPWIDGKTHFLDKMETKAGKHVARRRLDRTRKISRQITRELDEDFRLGLSYGLLGLIREFMDRNQDPNLPDAVIFLSNSWIPRRRKMLKTERDSKARLILQEAEEFCSLLLRESDGM